VDPASFPASDYVQGSALESIPEDSPDFNSTESAADESAYKNDFKIDPKADPIVAQSPLSLPAWEAAVKLIVPCQPIPEDPAVLKAPVAKLVASMNDQDLRLDANILTRAEAILADLS
jgi:hypothetical protein